jgi:hypothetical protein
VERGGGMEGPRLRGDSGRIAGEIRKLSVGQRFGVKEILIAAGVDEYRRDQAEVAGDLQYGEGIEGE